LSKGFNKVLIEWSDESGLIEVSKINWCSYWVIQDWFILQLSILD
jgi:hypothetical protein